MGKNDYNNPRIMDYDNPSVIIICLWEKNIKSSIIIVCVWGEIMIVVL